MIGRIGTAAVIALMPLSAATGSAAADTSDSAQASKVVIETVRVGAGGNPPDPATGLGAVKRAFAIGTYEVTLGQYTAFLNAVARDDRYALYDPRLEQQPNIAGIRQSGESGQYSYEVIGTPDRPVLFVSWFDAARFVNWLSNGQPTGAQTRRTTEAGTYLLKGQVRGNAPGRSRRNPNTGRPPRYLIPTEDQWYKAAFFDPDLHGGRGGYWRYPTRSNVAPGNAMGPLRNQANYYDGTYTTTGSAAYQFFADYLTPVGSFTGSAGPFGTFDQAGNVEEWNDLDGTPGPARGFRGAGWFSGTSDSGLSSLDRWDYDPSSQSNATGFRIAKRLPAATSARKVAAEALTYRLVRVGDPGNRADRRTGGTFGDVAKSFRIGRYEVTIGQYAAFLNAVADVEDPYGLYNPQMALNLNVAGIQRSGSPGRWTYSVLDNGGSSAQRPITFVSWFDAARFANWMSNGQPDGRPNVRTTEDGAYRLTGRTRGVAPSLRDENPRTGKAPLFALPTEDQWYKAAFYDPTLHKGRGGYWRFATRSDVAPGNAIGPLPNQGNFLNRDGAFSVTGSPIGSADQNYLTDVGSYTGSASFYGTFDQNGNVYEWNDLDGRPGQARGLRGSCWFGAMYPARDLSPLDRNEGLPVYEGSSFGFRLVAPGGRR